MTEKRSALIIANYEFEDNNLRQLVAPPQDAESLARVLADEMIGRFNVQTILNKPSHEVNQAIESFFFNRKRDDLLLLYFSGHGLKDEDGQLYFATLNTQHKFLRSTAVAAQFVNDVMRRSTSRRQVLFLDCCHSGAFGRVKGEKNIDTGEQFKGQGRVIITASDAMQYAFEGDEIHGQGIHSIFTRTLVRGLETGEADLDKDGQISLDELYNYVYEKVIDEKPEQTPQKWTFDLKGEIFIAQNKFYLSDYIQSPNQVYIEKISSLIKLGYRIKIEDDYIDKINWSPDGRLIAGLYYKNQSINIWNSETGELIQTIKTKWNKVTDFTWSPDGETIAIIADIRIIVSEELTSFKNIVDLEEQIKPEIKLIEKKRIARKV